MTHGLPYIEGVCVTPTRYREVNPNHERPNRSRTPPRHCIDAFETDTLGRVNAAYMECVASVELPEPGGGARLCDVYKEIHEKLELKSSLFGICDFKDGMSSVEAFCTVRLNSIIFFAGPFDLRFDLRTGSARKALTG